MWTIKSVCLSPNNYNAVDSTDIELKVDMVVAESHSSKHTVTFAQDVLFKPK